VSWETTGRASDLHAFSLDRLLFPSDDI
jgi:hypothetical protein